MVGVIIGKLADQWSKRMTVWCEKVRQWLGQVWCLFLRRMGTWGARVMDLEREWKGNPRFEWIVLHIPHTAR